MKKSALILAPAVFALAGCGGPSCDGSDTKSNIFDIAKENNEFTSWMRMPKNIHDSRPSYDESKDQNLANFDKKIADLNNQKGLLNPSDSDYAQKSQNFSDAISQISNQRDDYKKNENSKIENQANQTLHNIIESMSYSLDTIIKVAKNAETGSVDCKASLHASYGKSGDSDPEEITYTVEKTTDGKSVVTVWGLKKF